MIDIHSHIIPCMDDGAVSVEEAVQMATEAEKNGVKKIICTPHFISGRYENENLGENFRLLKEKLMDAGVEVELYLGNEVMFSAESFEAIKDGRVQTLAGSRYLLVEVFMLSKVVLSKGIELLVEMGYIPILAHIERYGDLDLHFFRSLCEKGALFQCNLGSLRNQRLRNKMEKFLNAGIVDFFASDAHNTRYRTYSIEEDIRQLKNLVGAERAEILLYENAEKVIRNEEIKKERNYVEENTGIAGYFSGMFSGLLRRVGFGRGTDKS